MLSSNFAVASSLLLSQVDMSPAPTRTAEFASVRGIEDLIWDRKTASKDVINRRANLFIFLLRILYYQSLITIVGSYSFHEDHNQAIIIFLHIPGTYIEQIIAFQFFLDSL